jgi:hypothetical protein
MSREKHKLCLLETEWLVITDTAQAIAIWFGLDSKVMNSVERSLTNVNVLM